jgi:hypothetical protein
MAVGIQQCVPVRPKELLVYTYCVLAVLSVPPTAFITGNNAHCYCSSVSPSVMCQYQAGNTSLHPIPTDYHIPTTSNNMLPRTARRRQCRRCQLRAHHFIEEVVQCVDVACNEHIKALHMGLLELGVVADVLQRLGDENKEPANLQAGQ